MASGPEVLRYIDSIAREKGIDKEGLIVAIEQAVAAQLAKKYGVDDLELMLDRDSGAWESNYELGDLEGEGRILAMAVKQAINTRIREAERDRVYLEYEQRIGDIIHGQVQRFEGDTVIVSLTRNVEGILPRAEKVRTENYNQGDRIRAMILEVKKVGPRVKIILSRAHRDLVRALFELEVPEIADGLIQIRRIEREPGYRTKVVVHSNDPKVDCVGACVGVRGSRIKSINEELSNERIDIIRWTEDDEELIRFALSPATVAHIELDAATRKCLAIVDEDELSLAIGRRGQNVRLASRITGWDIDIMTQAELQQTVAEEEGGTPAEGAGEGATAEGAGEESAAAGAIAEAATPEGATPADSTPETTEAAAGGAANNVQPTAEIEAAAATGPETGAEPETSTTETTTEGASADAGTDSGTAAPAPEHPTTPAESQPGGLTEQPVAGETSSPTDEPGPERETPPGGNP